MGNETKLGFVMFYFLFVSLLLLIAPFWGEGGITYQGSIPTDTSLPEIDLLNPFGFVGEIYNRFVILLTLSADNPLLGIILSVMTIGAFWVMVEMIRGN